MKKILLVSIILIFLSIVTIAGVKFISKTQIHPVRWRQYLFSMLGLSKGVDLLENVFIENYSFNKIEDSSYAVITLVAVNLNDKPLYNLPIKIDYYSKDNSYLSSDLCDVLEFTNASIEPADKKQFQIEVTFPGNTETAKVKIKR